MLIDWFTVVAQVANFLILMWLLKRFLYKPILRAIDGREAHIAETLRQAEEQKKAAESEHAVLRSRNEALDIERVHLLAQAQEDAKAAGRLLMDKERQAAEDSREQWRSSLAAERRRFGDEVSRRVRDEVFVILRRAFAELADSSLEERMVEVFDNRLRGSKNPLDDMLDAASGAAAGAPRSFLIRSAFPLSESQQETLRKTLADTHARAVDVRFQTEPNLIGGVELVEGGRKLAWTLDNYLGELESTVADLVNSPASAAKENAR